MAGRQITEFFNEDELRCKCGCGQMLFTDEAVRWLNILRQTYGGPIRVNSGYRCPDYNDRISSSGVNGPHTVTKRDNVSVDISVSGDNAYRLIAVAAPLGFTGVGIAQKGPHSRRFVHLDRIHAGGRHPRPWLWSY